MSRGREDGGDLWNPQVMREGKLSQVFSCRTGNETGVLDLGIEQRENRGSASRLLGIRAGMGCGLAHPNLILVCWDWGLGLG